MKDLLVNTWNGWTYKRKTFSVLIGFGCFFLASYLITIGDTVRLYFENNELRDKLLTIQNAPEQISRLERELNSGSRMQSDTDLRRELLVNFSKFCDLHQVTIKDMEQSETFTIKDWEIESHKLYLEGTFKNMVKVIYEAERTIDAGVMTSVAMKVEQDRRTKREYLISEIYFQRVNRKKQP